MTCPHCNYIDQIQNKETKFYDGNVEGDFFTLPIKVRREGYSGIQEETLYACPKCQKTFINRW